MASSIKINKTIKFLNLSNNNISLTEDLKFAVDESTSLVKLDLRNTKIGEGNNKLF